MIDITTKADSLRIATASAHVQVSEKSIKEINTGKVPKGDVFNSAKIAALFAVKNTSSVLPHCHPMPVEFCDVEFIIKRKNLIEINVTVKTIYKTGCEMEALHGVTVAALTVYDMLKPIDKNILIKNIKLKEKSGGKSEHKNFYDRLKIKSAILIISDTIYERKSKDSSGKLIKEKLDSYKIKNSSSDVVPDEIEFIQNKIKNYCRKKIDLIITTGGTGLSSRDVTFEAVAPLIEKEVTGIVEAARNYGQKRTPYAMLSRSVAGFIGDTLVLTLPGSINGVREYMDALFPYVLHLFKVRMGLRHE